MHKTNIRQALQAERAALLPQVAKEAGHAAQRMLLATAQFENAGVIALYSPVRNEVDTSDVFREALLLGKTVLYPRVENDFIRFRAVSGPEDLEQGAFGIMEPKRICSVVDPRETDLILVPGIAFDRRGKRIGYGRGYYDRTLHQREGSGTLVGFCYHFQLLDDIPAEPHDVVMDLIVTDKEVVSPDAPASVVG